MNSHHLILGELNDFLTGKIIEDNHDERYRQKIAKFLVKEKGYEKTSIIKNNLIYLEQGNEKFNIAVDYTLYIKDKPLMIIKYAPGSIVSRHMTAISCARLLGEYEIPLCVVTNGEDAETLDTMTGKTVSKGFEGIFTAEQLAKISPKRKITTDIREKARKILFAFEVDGRCPCDDSICINRTED